MIHEYAAKFQLDMEMKGVGKISQTEEQEFPAAEYLL
jgi:hypothetical protein